MTSKPDVVAPVSEGSPKGGGTDGRSTREVERVVIRFAGDSGDGMQLTGSRFTSEAGFAGNDLRTLPDFPAEIRAPAGTLAGVSSFQLSFSSQPIYTPGDACDVLVAMNPAALKVNLADLRPGGLIIANTSQFTSKNIEKAGFEAHPLKGDIEERFKIVDVDISKLTERALEDLGLGSRMVERSKNFFALGLTFWLYSRTLDNTLAWIDQAFGKKPEIAEANRRALKAGYFFGDTAELFDVRYRVDSAPLASGLYRNISGNRSLALGFVAASQKAGMKLFLGTYPITPASDILHELARFKHCNITTFQAEDEIAGVTSAIGAAFGGALGLTTSSGPGIALKAEGMGLALMVELPLVVVNVQRGGPSTGLPTKTEQADLLQVLYGRNGESSLPVLAASTPADCFEVGYEACRIALKYMTPVIVLSDGYIANGSEPWKIPTSADLPPIDVTWWEDKATFEPYRRDPETLARPRVLVGTPGMEHRVGGLEKEHGSGNVSYDADNHERMVRLRTEKVQRIAQEIPPMVVSGDTESDLLLLGWGSTHGAILGAAMQLREAGIKVATTHLRFVNPLPSDLGDILRRYKHVIVPELNLGQLSTILRSRYLVDVKSICKVQGRPFKEQEIVEKVRAYLAGAVAHPFTNDACEPERLAV